MIIVIALLLMAFSIAVRWSGIGGNLSVPEEPFQIEVLNGTGEPGVAREVTMKLRRMGIDVLIEGNAGHVRLPGIGPGRQEGKPGADEEAVQKAGSHEQ